MNLFALILLAAIPLHLPVDISRPTSPAFPAYHGESLEIEAELKDRGTAFNVALTSPQLYYQTPGMGNNWWTLPATQTNNLLRATFPASADPGEDRLICFLGSAGENFRASFILNFRHAPGTAPNTLELPVPTLDFSQITVLNPPYVSTDTYTNTTAALEAGIEAVSNAVVSARTDLSAAIAAATPADYNTVKDQVSTNAADIAALKTGKQDSIADLSDIRAGAALGATALQSFTESDPTVPSWAKADNKPTYAYSEITGTPTIPTVPTTVSSFTNDVGYLTSYTETDPTISSWAKASSKPSYAYSEISGTPTTWAWSALTGLPTTLAGYGITDALSRTSTTMTSPGIYTEYLINGSLQGGVKIRYSSTSDANQTTYMYSGVAARRNGSTTDYLWDTSSQSGIVRRSELSNLATTSDLAAKADASITNQISTIASYLTGDDARVIITNLDSQVELPRLSFEWKVSDGGTNYWETIWDELSRFTWLQNTYLPTNYYNKAGIASLLDDKADRAWGFYDSHTGNYSPDDYTWISSPSIAISGGLAYEKYITSAGNIWLLESNGMTVQTTGVETNGFLRVKDGDGTVLTEIIKGDKRTVGAAASSVSVNGTTLSALYPVASAEHPTLYASTNLVSFVAESDNSCPCTVVWSGTSGAWTAAVTPKGSTPAVFAKAEYEIGGETYIHHAAPTKLDYIIIGNTKYSIGTTTISGNTVLTLTEAL